ncbi:hypothetical protein AB3H79_08060 [Enterococcus sp. C92]
MDGRIRTYTSTLSKNKLLLVSMSLTPRSSTYLIDPLYHNLE